MILYTSSRGDGKLYSFSEAILKGIAEDGGLLIPEKIPQIKLKQLELLLNKSYQERAVFLFELFKTGIRETKIKEIINQAYSSSNFDDKQIVPLVHLKGREYIQELWHGPTAAFKDLALQVMPLFFQASIRESKYLILTATSGDTGKAALEGFKNKKHISIIVFYPEGLISKLQELQMSTQEGKNLKVYAVRTDFDGVQKLVKNIFNDGQFNQQLKNEYGTMLSSANSINWGRLMPQIVYHISGYLDLVNIKAINFGDQIDIAVPTGNFGNILAAFYAKKMGLPIRKLICASNENNVLSEFLQTGIYDIKNRQLTKTHSPSMDILVASNIERLLYIITSSPEKVSTWMNQLKTEGKFEVDNYTKTVLKEEFYANWVSNKECLKNIKQVYDETKYIMDPHTSVAQSVTHGYLSVTDFKLSVLISSTAHWAKFGNEVYRALFPEGRMSDDEFEIIDKICDLDPNLKAPNSLSSLKLKKPIYTKVVGTNQEYIKELIREFAISI